MSFCPMWIVDSDTPPRLFRPFFFLSMSAAATTKAGNLPPPFDRQISELSESVFVRASLPPTNDRRL